MIRKFYFFKNIDHTLLSLNECIMILIPEKARYLSVLSNSSKFNGMYFAIYI